MPDVQAAIEERATKAELALKASKAELVDFKKEVLIELAKALDRIQALERGSSTPPALKNENAECWPHCGKGGACPGFCGVDGACCRKGWDNDNPACDNGASGCDDMHCCVAGSS